MKPKTIIFSIFLGMMFFILTACQNNIVNDEVVSKESVIPENCKTWFDGCNNCIMMEGKMGACTRKYCPPEAMKEPKCLEFME